MGSSTSTIVSSTNTIMNSHNIITGKGTCSAQGITQISIGPAKVFNASRNPVRIYLAQDKPEVSDLTCQKGPHMCFMPNPCVPFRTVPPLGSLSLEVGDDLASVFVQDEHDQELVVSTICMSSPVPLGRSFIVTHDYQIKIQSQTAGDKWMDEDGTDHTPK